MRIIIVREPVAADEVRELAREIYKDMVKGVADIEKGIIALGGEWHADANNELLREGSGQRGLWGFNLYPDRRGDDALEYVSLINIRPTQGNKDMELKDEGTRRKIRTILEKLIPELFV